MLIHELLIMLMMTRFLFTIYLGGRVGVCDLHILIIQARNNSMFYTFALRKSQTELMAPI